ncbi:peptidylprolyl isomerase [Inhella gelatinilytica]|uniref:peptidylprolyl isomerase n=1 Tax=Inhella gelatinilytica TaxID=2795030 RepID=A0A931IWS9_9BURK|nr:peptidylprolyl isomerase [Inhella gelatinilytica]MBH9552073.1 peptidylprolyl isomerase [Inhella gelatinilytica]
MNAPTVNGVAIATPDEQLDADTLRQRAHTELLRQAAQRDGLLGAEDQPTPDGVLSEAASQAIETWLDRHLALPEPDDAACRRYHAANAAQFGEGEQVSLRHILFAVTEGVDVSLLRQHAERMLLQLRAADRPEAFAEAAGQWSNCPSGQHGGQLGELRAEDCAPEFAKEIFGHPEVGVLPRLVHSRFGLHVVEVLARKPGTQPLFEQVRSAVQQRLRQQTFTTALRHTLMRLASEADLVGVPLDTAETPLVQ